MAEGGKKSSHHKERSAILDMGTSRHSMAPADRKDLNSQDNEVRSSVPRKPLNWSSKPKQFPKEQVQKAERIDYLRDLKLKRAEIQKNISDRN